MNRSKREPSPADLDMVEVLLIAFIVAATVFIVVKIENYRPPRRAGGGSAGAQNVRQMALAALMYAGDYDDGLPLTVNGQLSRMQNRKQGQLTINCPGPGTQELPAPEAAGGEPTLAWPTLMLPYIKSRVLFVDPVRGDSHQIWAHEAVTPGDPNYDAEGATLRNQNRFPMFGYNYMFLSPLRIPKAKRGLPNAINYAVADSHKSTEADDPSGTIFFATSQASLSDPSRGFFVVNAPGMWATFAKETNGLVGFWNGTPGTGDWVGTNTACPDDSNPCTKPQPSYGFVYMLNPAPAASNVAYLDGHVKYTKAEALAAGTTFPTAVAGSDGSGAVIVDRKKYLWDLK